LRYREPASVAEARFSLEFFAGAALSRGWVGLNELSAQVLCDPVVRTVMSKVKRVISNDLDPTADGYAVFDLATVTLRDGRVLESRPVIRAKGHASNPLSPQDARKKFEDCLQSVGRGEIAGGLFEAISGLSDRQDRPVPSLLRREFRQNEPLL
jgi:2-methylcitrate dehydratase PrpD